jgi:hypothetical protein
MTRPTLFGERFLPPEPTGPPGPPEGLGFSSATEVAVVAVGALGMTLVAGGGLALLVATTSVSRTRGASRSVRLRRECARAEMREAVREAREIGRPGAAVETDGDEDEDERGEAHTLAG